MSEDDRRLTGEGWRVLAVAAFVFGLGSLLFAATGDWWPSIPAALGAVLLASEARRMRQRWRSDR